MSRRDNYDEDWERRKSYLIRSLFQDVHTLSPVSEEEETIDSPRSAILPSSTAVKVSRERPYSPLPPLIVEKEPIINKHDEPPEFYAQLEKKIMKIYRKMFIEDRSDESSVGTDLSTTASKDSFGERYREEGTTETIHDVITEQNGYEIVDENNSKITKTRTSSSVASIESEQNASDNKRDIEEEEISSSTDVLPKSTTDDGESDIEDLMSDETANNVLHKVSEELADLEENYDVDIIDDTQRIDVMRTPTLYKSAGSMPKQSTDGDNYSYDDHNLKSRSRSRSLEVHTESNLSKELSQNNMESEELIDYDIPQTSIQDGGNNSSENNHRKKKTASKRKSSSPLSSRDSKILRYQDASVQVDFETDDDDTLYFVGTPLVYVLRSCENH